MLYQSSQKRESHIPVGDWVVYCDRCWGIITHLERESRESLGFAKEKENVCLYCRRKEMGGIKLAP